MLMRGIKPLSFVVLPIILISLVPDVLGQGQRCDATPDCTSEYAPFCSKWGWCVWTDLYGNEGPPQSAGAEEDGERGQCRTDTDCTRWAPICSPLGYCRSGFWDGSFGAPSNPRPGQEPSQWIKDNASKYKTGTKENPNPNNARPDTQPDNKQSATSAAGSRRGSQGGSNGSGGSQGGSRGSGGSKRNNGGSRRGSESPRGGGNTKYQDEIKQGKIPGVAGKDYPTNSINSVRKQYPGIKPAPKDKITKDYPLKGKSGNRRKSNQTQPNNRTNSSNAKGCPGNLSDCMASCPSDIKVFKACVASCGRRCRRK